MRTLYVIGTVHGGISSKEISDMLGKYNPGQVLVEAREKDVRQGNLSEYPSEMRLAFAWAKNHDGDVHGFDDESFDESSITISEEEKQRIEKVNAYLTNKDWKELNKKGTSAKIRDLYGSDPLTDEDRARQKKMLKNIKKHLLSEGTVVVFTGIGHVDFFEEYLPEARFPFR